MAVSEEECSSAKSRSSSSTSSSTYYLAKCVLRGSVVLQVLYGHIRSPSSLDVVFGKETSIELVVIGEDGVVQSVCEQPVFGTIKDMAILPWNERFRPSYTQMLGKDLLIVISDSGKLSFLTFCNEMHRFLPVTHIQLSNPGNSRNQVGRMLASDSSGCFIAASAYENRLALFSTSVSAGSNIVDKRITYPPDGEGDSVAPRSMQKASICGAIWSMCFISKDHGHLTQDNNAVLAVLLNRKGAILNELLLLGWNIREQTIHVLSQFLEDGPLAYEVVEVPQSYGFALLFRVGDALLMDLRDAYSPCCVYRIGLHFPPNVEQNFIEESYRVQDADDEGLFNVAACALLELRDYDPMCIDSDDSSLNTNQNLVCSWSWEPGNNRNRRMIFGMDTGELFMIEMNLDSDGLKVNQSACLYKGLPYKVLLWVEGGYLAALVEMGDGMVLKLENGRLIYANPIQNVAPILDMSVVDKHDEKQDQMFACCGMAPEGSLRIIRNGISVESLLRTAPIYQGITGIWTIKMKLSDAYHSYLVLSFVEETRVLSVGLSFIDVTDSVGFQSDICTLACGLLDDGLLVQIHQNAVRLCLPTKVAHSEGIELSSPARASWFPDNIGISLGAVGHNVIVVSTSNPCFLFILGVRKVSGYDYEIYEKQYLRLQNELSCISIPEKHFTQKESNFFMNSVENSIMSTLLNGVSSDYIIVIGTHRPSVEILSFVPSIGLRVLASGTISLMNILGNAVSGCIPQDVRLVLVDRFYILTGLRNGMLLRFEWPHSTMMNSSDMPMQSPVIPFLLTSPDSFNKELRNTTILEKHEDEIPSSLQLIAIRRIGITPVFLVPLTDWLDSDIIVLSDRPWLLHSARHGLSYTSISFQPSTHVTPVCSAECPNGLLFVAESSLHLVEMVHSKRLNVQKFHLGGTPRKVLYHSESKLLLVMRTQLINDTCSSDICCVDPLSGSILSSFKLEMGETGKSMELVRNGNEQVLIVGTSLSSGPAIMPSGEAESTKGRMIVLCLEHVQNSDTGSMTFCSKAGLSSLQTSPFREIVGYATEQLSSSSLCSSPDDASSDGIKLEETEAWQLRVVYSTTLPGMVLAICPYLDRYFLASAGNAFYVCGFPSDSFQRVKRLAVGRTRFMITSLTAHVTRIVSTPSFVQTKFRTHRLLCTGPSSSYYPRCQGGAYGLRVVKCASSNGKEPDSLDDGVKSVEQLLKEKQRAELSARIASGEFTVEKAGFPSVLRSGLSKMGVPSDILDLLFGFINAQEQYPKIPEAKGSLDAVRSEAFFIPLYELYLTYGGIFRLSFGPKSFLIVSDPSIAKHILKNNPKNYSKGILAEILDFVMGKGLIPADGEIWRVRRRAIVPSLHMKYVGAMINVFGEAADRLCNKLDDAASNGVDVEMESLFSRLTLDIIGKAVFNYDFDSLTNDTGIVEAVYTVLREAEDRSVAPIPVWEIPIWKDISPRQKKVSKALKLINETLDQLIAICKRMVDEEELQFHEEYMNEQDPSILHFLLASGDDVSSKQLRDDLMTMLIAGHETTAAVLTWTFYLLSKEPRIMAKLQEEVDSVLGDRFPTIEDMKNLKYATRIINESLRLYPQPPVLIRRSLDNDTLGKYPIKKGEDIFISVWNLHRSPELWDDADKFNPERWPLDGPNPNETNQNFRYLPFGGGPRKCVGDMFALYEAVVALAMLVRRFDFQMALGAPPVKMTTGATIHTTDGLKMTVTRRMKPPIIPTLEKMPAMVGDSSVGFLKDETEIVQEGEVSSAHS